MRVLITGANGFLGSHLVESSLLKGYETFALLRPNGDLRNLENLSGYQVLSANYDSFATLSDSLDNQLPFDLIIHNVGLTKSYTMDKYINVNVKLTELLIEIIKSKNLLKPAGNFAYISSLAAKGPIGKQKPASNYGISKVQAEELIKASGINYMIFRPTGIYGSRDIQFIPLINSVKLGIYPLMTSPSHKMTLIHARDVADNVIECSFAHKNHTVHLEDGQVYEHADLKGVLEGLLNKKSVNLKVPQPVVKFLLRCSDIIDRRLKRTPKLSLEHYSEISQDWDFDFSDERQIIPLKINYPLREGFEEALNFYKEKGLI